MSIAAVVAVEVVVAVATGVVVVAIELVGSKKNEKIFFTELPRITTIFQLRHIYQTRKNW